MADEPKTLPHEPAAIREGPTTRILGRDYPVEVHDGYPTIVTSEQVRRCKCGLPFVGFRHPTGTGFVQVLASFDLAHHFNHVNTPAGKQVVSVCPRAIRLIPWR